MKYAVVLLGLNLFAGHLVLAQPKSQSSGGKAPGIENRIGTESVKSDSLLKKSVLPLAQRLTAFLPDSALATGTAVLLLPKFGVTPGSVDQENSALAARLVTKGIAVFVLTYRLGQDSLNASAMALDDGKRGIAYLRGHAAEVGIRPSRIGVLGLSTGGILALQLACDRTETMRPNFVSLFQAEVGTVAAESVPPDAPVLFIGSMSGVTSDKDRQAAIQNAALYQQWLRAGRSAEFHSYAMNSQLSGTSLPTAVTEAWLAQWTDWLARQDYLPERTVAQSQQPVAAISTEPSSVLPTAPSSITMETASVPTGKQSTQATPVQKVPTEPIDRGGLLSIKGTVRDSATNQPLSRATVLIDYEKVGKGTYTDEQGHFDINLRAGKHIIVIRSIGYLPFRTTLYVRGNTALNIPMSSVASQLEEVVVTSKGYDRTVREPLLGVTQISMKTLERLPSALGEVDILRGLQLLPGVTSVGEAANGLNIRGGTTDQNLILMDDTPDL